MPQEENNSEIINKFKRIYKVSQHGKEYIAVSDDKNTVMDVVPWAPFEVLLKESLQKTEKQAVERFIIELLKKYEFSWIQHESLRMDIKNVFLKLYPTDQ